MSTTANPFAGETTHALLPAIAEDEIQEYSLHRALQVAGGADRGPSLEREIGDVLGSRLPMARGRGGGGRFAIPTAAVFGALDSATVGEGAELVFERPGGRVVDALRARSVTGTLGATVFDDMPLPLRLPAMSTDPDITWLAEEPGTPVSDTEPSFRDGPRFALHTAVASVPYTRQLLAQTAGPRSIERVLRAATQAAFAAELDRVAIEGSAANEPTGILGTAGVNIVAIGTNGGAPDYATMTALEEAVAVDDADIARLGFATTPGVRKLLRETERAAGSGPIWPEDTVLGHPAAVSTNVPSDLTKGTGTNLHAIVYGSWSELLIAMLPVIDVIIDPYILKKQGIVEATFYLYCDIQLAHAESFAVVVDATV